MLGEAAAFPLCNFDPTVADRMTYGVAPDINGFLRRRNAPRLPKAPRAPKAKPRVPYKPKERPANQIPSRAHQSGECRHCIGGSGKAEGHAGRHKSTL